MASTLAEKEAARERLDDAARRLAGEPRERRQLIEALAATVVDAAVEQSARSDSVGDLRGWAELSAAFAALVRRLGPAQRDALTAVLDRAAREEDDDDALTDWGRLRVLTMYEQVRADCHTVGWLEDQGISRQRVNQWRAAGRLHGIKGVPGVRGFAYPRWQFDGSLHPRDFMPAVVAAADDARIDPLALHLFMTNPGAGNGRTPLELVEQGELALVERLLRAAGAQA